MNVRYAMVKDEFRRPVARWLMLCAILVASMVVVGGYTRLSGSGLSITEWKPIHGVIPPLSLAEWQEEFDLYRMSPQYAKVNAGMTLDEFKAIFWPEFLHRLLGRAIGFVFLFPMLYFAARRAVSFRLFKRLCVIFLLGGAQGGIGWYMVASGLVNDPYVSHHRLALHLSFALLILACILWTWLDLRPRPAAGAKAANVMRLQTRRYTRELTFIFALLCLQIVYGAFMAGLHAGLIYNTFPTMNGEWVPKEVLNGPFGWLHLTENIATVQFIHRWLGISVLVFLNLWWLAFRKNAINLTAVKMGTVSLAMCWFQVVLGIMTLLTQVKLDLALLHQFTAMMLFVSMLALLHTLRREQS